MKFRNLALVVFYNLAIAAIFILLCIHFNNWWLMLISILSMSRLDSCSGKQYHTVMCDSCGIEVVLPRETIDRNEYLRGHGWRRFQKITDTDELKYIDICPCCSSNYDEHGSPVMRKYF